MVELNHYCEIEFPPSLAAQAELLCAGALAVDGVEPLSEQAVALIYSDPQVLVLHGWLTDADRLVAYGNADCRHVPTVEMVVDPTWRNKGVGTQLLQLLVGAAEQVGPGDSAEGGTVEGGIVEGGVAEGESVMQDSRTMVWSHGDLPAARTIAERVGLVRNRELLQMRCPVDDFIPHIPDLPEGMTVMTLAEGDARYGVEVMNREMLRVNQVAFFWHPEQGKWTLADVERHRRLPWFDDQECFVALRTPHPHLQGDTPAPPQLVGFSWSKMHGDDDHQVGELYVVGVDPAVQGMRLGTLLTSLVLRRVAARGAVELMLYVEGDNASARAIYQKNGFRISRCDVAYRYPDTTALWL